MILLDSHVLVWLDQDLPHLGRKARRILDGAHVDSLLAVSAISFWEIAMLIAKGRLTWTGDLLAWRAEVLASGIRDLPVSGDIAVSAGQLSAFHGDPADRLILATALSHDSRLMTADEKILAYKGVRTVNARR